MTVAGRQTLTYIAHDTVIVICQLSSVNCHLSTVVFSQLPTPYCPLFNRPQHPQSTLFPAGRIIDGLFAGASLKTSIIKLYIMAVSNLLYILILIFLGLPFLYFFPPQNAYWLLVAAAIGVVLFVVRIARGDD